MECPLHPGEEMQEKDGQYGSYYSHTIPNVGYCNGKKITPFKTPQTNSDVRPASTLAKKHDSMLLCNSMNNAVQMVIANPSLSLATKFDEILNLLESKS